MRRRNIPLSSSKLSPLWNGKARRPELCGFTQDAASISAYLLVERTELCPADLILVFGNPKIIPELARESAALYNQNYAPRIVVTGGIVLEDGRTEADCLRGALRRQGIPSSAIIYENNSRNTQENILFTKRLLQSAHSSLEVKSVIGVGHAVAGRRFLMTLAQNWPELDLIMASNVWPNQKSWATDWHLDTQKSEAVLSQLARLPLYLKKGYIKEVDLDALNEKIRLRQEPPLTPRETGFEHGTP